MILERLEKILRVLVKEYELKINGHLVEKQIEYKTFDLYFEYITQIKSFKQTKKDAL